MDAVSIAIISSLAFFAVLGLIVGLVKGFAKSGSWAVEYLLATVIAVAASGFISETLGDDGIAGFAVTGVAIVIFLLFSLISGILRKVFAKNKEKRKGGFGNACNRLFGGFATAVKGAVFAGAVAAAVLTVLDFAQLESVGETFGEIYASEAWATFKPYIMDFLVVGVITASLSCGYSNGISSVLWSIIVLGLVAGAGYLSYHLAFNVEAFQGAAASLENTLIGVLGDMTEAINGSGITTLAIAQGILTAGLFFGMLVFVIMLAIFVPKMINVARDGKIFCAVDGIFGAMIACAVALGALMFVGGVLQTISDLEFMNVFTSYFDDSKIAVFYYTRNSFAALGIMPEIPLRDWLA